MAFYLYLMRHAKSDWSVTGQSDFDRTLNKRGCKNARRMGQWTVEHDLIPELIVCSSAIRAKQTVELMTGEFPEPVSIHFDKELYLADIEILVEHINLYKPDTNSLMIVAHNPGLEYLINSLNSNTRSGITTHMSMTTANLVIFEYQDSGFNPMIDKGKLLEFIKPRELD